jgi:hypothetical protein
MFNLRIFILNPVEELQKNLKTRVNVCYIFLKLIYLIEIIYLNKFNKKHLKKLFYTNKSRRFTLRRNIYFIQNINILKTLSLLKFMQGFNLKNFNHNKKI